VSEDASRDIETPSPPATAPPAPPPPPDATANRPRRIGSLA
jgi:hypothetical protein